MSYYCTEGKKNLKNKYSKKKKIKCKCLEQWELIADGLHSFFPFQCNTRKKNTNFKEKLSLFLNIDKI